MATNKDIAILTCQGLNSLGGCHRDEVVCLDIPSELCEALIRVARGQDVVVVDEDGAPMIGPAACNAEGWATCPGGVNEETDILVQCWLEHHPNSASAYYIRPGTACDRCGRVLTNDERLRNMQENVEQDGNAAICDQCETN